LQKLAVPAALVALAACVTLGCSNPSGISVGPPPGEYSVTFSNGAVGPQNLKTLRVSNGAAVGENLFPANPRRDGYDFAGWNTLADGSGTAFTASTAVSANITVYAQWVELPPHEAAVRFIRNDGTENV
jgi:uncharacterized repeat protein (TIGR02543 family)